MINGILIPAVVIVLMMIVGTGLQPSHFTELLRSPRPLIGATLLQAVLLPLMAMIVLVATETQFELAIGLLLVAASPGGALSNYYCHLGRMDTALSVILTTASSVLAFLLMPVILTICLSVLVDTQEIDIEAIDLIVRLVVILLAPLVLGMLLRHHFAESVEASAHSVRRISLILVVILLALIVFDQWSTTQQIFVSAAWVSILFTLGALLLGWLSGLALKMGKRQRYTTATEFAVRNAGIAAMVAASSLGRPEFAAFSALFVVFQFPIILVWIGWYRGSQNRAAAREVGK